ncbi:flagellar motor switch protein FliN [Candidatus Thalassolituus haligoni]|uniref:flagellar motor switch protein FliN n=1 Tax=Candidatus Thalassolituus haligoni TaxID=3100113 RepID=UPI003513FC1C|tara:strand:+ start:1910 stop:2380 length:471 start_codon:yes stop_codon:yes gene_type:complete
MSDDNEELDPQALADQVAAGIDAAGQDDQALADEWAAAMEESGDVPEDEVQAVELEELKDESKRVVANPDGPELDVILDIPVRISMEVGSTQIPIRNLLQLNQGSVVELDRLAGEPLDVLVNGTLIAHGEVVMVNDKFGIRLTDVVSQSERIQRLR